jgi:ElaB/YqjD/DUF883 family membrane-anchored ribosome-binding protein
MDSQQTSVAEPGGLPGTASNIADEVGRTASSQADTLMTRAEQALHQVAAAVRNASGELREQQPQVATFADTATERVEQFADYLGSHRAQDLMDEAQRFARQQPVAIIGGGLLLGFGLSRLLRAADSQGGGQRGSGDWYRQGYRGQNGTYDTTYGTGYGSDMGADTPSTGYGTGYGASLDTAGTGMAGTAGSNGGS